MKRFNRITSCCLLAAACLFSHNATAQPGALDLTFKPGKGTGANSQVSSLALQPDGKVIIGGSFNSYNGTERNYIARLNPDGSLDGTFDPGTGTDSNVLSLALQPDGKVIIGGLFTSYNGTERYRIARLNADGSLDGTFDPGTWGEFSNLVSLALQPDGKVLIGGISYNETERNNFARLNADGSLDETFDPGTGIGGVNCFVSSLALQPDGKVLIGGFFTSYNGTGRNNIARLNADGSLDETFDSGTGANSPIQSLALQPDGKVLIGGFFTSYNGTGRNYMARLNADGSLDGTFNPGPNSGVLSFALQPDGKMLIGGLFTTYNGTGRKHIARLNTDGSLDGTFNPGKGANNSWVLSLALQPDSKVLIGGDFSTYNGITGRRGIARVMGDATGPDTDGDGIPDDSDNCPASHNPGQEDSDRNGIGDDCEVPKNQIIAFETLQTKTYGDEPFSLPLYSTSESVDQNCLDACTEAQTNQIAGCEAAYDPTSCGRNTACQAEVAELRIACIAETYTTANDCKVECPTNDIFQPNPDLPIHYSSSNEDVAIIVGNQVIIVGAGTTIITASQPGNDDFLPAENVEQLLTVLAPASDTDGDGIPDDSDNCPETYNPGQEDTNDDGIGDVCQPPSMPASNIIFSGILSDRATVNFIKGNGTHRAVLIAQTSAEKKDPKKKDPKQKIEVGDKEKKEGEQKANEGEKGGSDEKAKPKLPPKKATCKAFANNFVEGTIKCFNGSEYKVAYVGEDESALLTDLDALTDYEVVIVEFLRVNDKDYYSAEGAAIISFTTLAYPNVHITSPADGATDRKTKLNLTSKAVTGASVYTIEISPESDFSEGVLAKSGGRTQLFDSLQYNTTYYTRVKTNLRPDYGGSTTFTTQPAEQLAYVVTPKDSAVNQKVTVSVTSNLVPLALEYTIELNTSPDFNGASFVQTGARKQVFDSLQYNTTYYSRVKTEFTENWGATRLFTTIDAANISYVVTPKDTSVNQNVNLNIAANNVPGATEYAIQLSESPDFSTVAFEMTGPTRTLAFAGLKYNTTYHNRVRTNMSESWGVTRSFTTRTAQSISYVTSPANGAVDRNTNLNISSNNVPGATEYTIQLSESPDFSTIAFEVTGETRTLAFAGLTYNTTYYNRVKTNLSSDENDGWGAVRSFTTRTAESLSYVTSPADGAVDRNTSLNISSNNVPGATEYTIQLSESQDFSTIAFEVSGPTRTVAFSGLKYNTTYFNRVRTNLTLIDDTCLQECDETYVSCVIAAGGDPVLTALCDQNRSECIESCEADDGEWGVVKSFTTRTVESISYVTSPADGAVDRSITLNVTSSNVPGAAQYTIQLSESPDFSTIDFEVSGETKTLAFAGLKYNTTYYNRVGTDQSTGFGQVRSFTTRTAESLAYVTSPADGAVDRNTTLNITSSNVPGATQYTIQLSESPDFSTIAFEVSGETKTLAFAGLKYNTTYYNRVSTDLTTEFGQVRSFTTRTAESLAYVTSPADGAVDRSTSLNIKSNTVPGATGYTIQLSESPDFSTIDFEVSGETATLAFLGLKYNTTYYNRVGTELSTEFGQVRSFTTRTAESISYVTSPADGAVDRNTNLNITSNVVPGASSYTVQLSEAPDFSVIAFEVTSPTKTLAFSGLNGGTTYYNRVTTNAPGTEGYGQVKSFTTKGSPPAARMSSNATSTDQVEEVELSEELMEFEVRVYPNPFREKLVLYIEARDAQQANVLLMDANGKAVHESIEQTNSTVEIEKPLSVGIYLLRVVASGQTKTVRVVKVD